MMKKLALAAAVALAVPAVSLACEGKNPESAKASMPGTDDGKKITLAQTDAKAATAQTGTVKAAQPTDAAAATAPAPAAKKKGKPKAAQTAAPTAAK